MSQPPDLFTSEQVSVDLRIDRSTLSRWVEKGIALPAMKLPGKTGTFLFTAAEIARLKPIADQRRRAAA